MASRTSPAPLPSSDISADMSMPSIVAHACNGIIITMAMINIAAMVPVRVLCL